jgi:hypothetical protein
MKITFTVTASAVPADLYRVTSLSEIKGACQDFQIMGKNSRQGYKLTDVIVSGLNTVETFSPGDVVKDADGAFFLRSAENSWLRFGDDFDYHDDVPVRPLVRLST